MTRNKFNNELQHFSIRKLTVGAASVLIGISFLAGNKANTVKADTINDNSNDVKAVQEDSSADKEVANNYQASDNQNTQNQDSIKTDTTKQEASGMTFDKSSSAVQKTVKSSDDQSAVKSDSAQAPVKQEAKQAPVQNAASQNAELVKASTVKTDTSAAAENVSSKTSQSAVNTESTTPAESHVNALEVKQNSVKAPEIKVSNVSSISESARALTQLRTRRQLMIANVYAVVPAQPVDPNKIQDGQTFHTSVGFKGNPMNTYLDYKYNGTLVGTQKISGNTGDTVTFTPQLPDGYVATGSVPTSIKLENAMGNTAVPVTHGTYHVNNGEGKNAGDRIPGTTGKTFATGVTNGDLNRDITRTITVNMPNSKYGNNQTINQTETWYRGADVDMVTGQVIRYTAWVLKPGSANSMSAYNPNAIPGYTVHVSDPDQSGTTNTVNVLTPGASSIDGWQQANHNANITYSANDQSVTFQFWDQDLNKEISHFDKTGVTDQNIQTGLTAPAHYDIVGSIPSSYTFGATNPTVRINFKHHINPNEQDHHLPNIKESDYQENVTRTITINVPDGNVTVDKNGSQTVASHPVTTPQKITLTRTFSYDEVDQKVVGYGAWSTSTFDAVPVTVPAGYTVHVTGVTLDSKGQIPSDVAKNGYVDPHINITFTANAGKQTINYTDSTGHIIGTSVINGVTDQTVAVPNGMPTGWTTAPNATVPSTVHIHATDNPITVGITHHITRFTHDTPIPDNGKTSTGKTINGGHASDLAKTITRTVTIHQPSTYDASGVLQPGDATPHIDSISYVRDGSYDDVTGNVTYDNWVKTTADANKTLPEIDIPNHPGYTPSRTQAIPAQDPTNDEINNWNNPNINVTYTAQDKTQTINFTDDKGNILHTQTVPGKTDSIVNLNPEIPDGWVPVNDNEIPGQIIIRPTDTPINYQVKHGQYVVSHKNPVNEGDIIPGTTAKKFPKGLTQTDLNLTTTRIISVHFPSTFDVPDYLASQMDGQGNIVQHITFWRDATVDTVTGQILSYNGPLAGGWNADNGTGAFPAITIPDVPGYTAQITTDNGAGAQNVQAATAVRRDGSIVSPQRITIRLVRAGNQNNVDKPSEAKQDASSVTTPNDAKPASDALEKADNPTSESKAETTPSKPAENTPAKSTDQTASKPVENAPAKSADQTASKPVENTPAKSTDQTASKPAENAPAKSDSTKSDSHESADSKGAAKPASDQNTKSDSNKPADPQKPAENAPAKSDSDNAKSDSTKQPQDSAKPSDNQSDSSKSNAGQIVFNNGSVKPADQNNANKPAQLANTDSANAMSSDDDLTNVNASSDSNKPQADPAVANNNANDVHRNAASSTTDSDSANNNGLESVDNRETSASNVETSASNRDASAPASANYAPAENTSASNAMPEEMSYASDSSDDSITPLAQNAPASNVTVVPANTATILPQTGNQNAEVLAAIGVAASGLAILGLAGTRKRKNA